MGSKRRRARDSKPTAKTLAYHEAVKAVVFKWREYWPLTVRQVYYQLVAAGAIANTSNAYKKLSFELARLRVTLSEVPWQAIEDRNRTILPSGGWPDGETFADQEVRQLFTGYRRDLLQSQEARPEVWVEKDALAHIAHGAAEPYCASVVAARGFCSVSFVHDLAERVRRNAAAGQTTTLLYFGDMDPSGWFMLPTMLETLQREMGLGDLVEGVRCALTPEQIEAHDLLHNPDAIKEKDTRRKKYVAQFGKLAVELDALPADVLRDMVAEAIEGVLDVSRFEAERAIEADEVGELGALRSRARELLKGL